jgi:hypothetical protein
VWSTYHRTLQKTPGQLVFGWDMIFNVQHTSNWEYIRQHKQLPRSCRPGPVVRVNTLSQWRCHARPYLMSMSGKKPLWLTMELG